jgi:hypothetical protein
LVSAFYRVVVLSAVGLRLAALGARQVQADCDHLPDHDDLQEAALVEPSENGGLGKLQPNRPLALKCSGRLRYRGSSPNSYRLLGRRQKATR